MFHYKERGQPRNGYPPEKRAFLKHPNAHGLNSREEPDDWDIVSKTRVKAEEGGAVLIGSENVKRI